MSTFQRSSLGEGAGSCPWEAQNSGPQLSLPPGARAPSATTWPMSPQSRACCQANVKSLPVAPSLWLRSAGVDRLRSLGSGDPLLKHSHRVQLCSPCASRCSPLPWLRAGGGALPQGQGFLGHRALSSTGLQLIWDRVLPRDAPESVPQ